MDPGINMRRLVPKEESCCWTEIWAPVPIACPPMTALTPIMTPKIERIDRTLLAVRALKACRKYSLTLRKLKVEFESEGSAASLSKGCSGAGMVDLGFCSSLSIL